MNTSHICLSKIGGVQYYRRHELRFTSAARFIAAQLLQEHRFRAGFDDGQQKFFNSRRLVRAQRVHLLSTLAERAVQVDGPWVISIDLLRMENSSRTVRHPDFRQSHAQLQLHLQAFVQNGGAFAYRLAPQGPTTLTQLAEQERRRQDLQRLQFWAAAFAALTALGVFVKTEQIQSVVGCAWRLLGWVVAFL